MRNVITTENAPQAIGPYSVAIQTENFVFCSGQLGLNPANGELVADDVAAQTRQALTNLKNILEAAGSSLQNVVKTTVFLKDMADFPKMNAVYSEFFPDAPPARSTIAVAGLPKGGLVEIEATALR
ncbi:MAG: reactive intermediate/imine deaminase [Anaerolineae bacterium]|nr:MAG: reactive intermediate/imine deaminase [Anaerolineae bacterium]